MKTRITALLLSFVLAFALSGCQSVKDEVVEVTNPESSSFSESSTESESQSAVMVESSEAESEITAQTSVSEEKETIIAASTESDNEGVISVPAKTTEPAVPAETTKPIEQQNQPTQTPNPTEQPTTEPEKPTPQPTEEPTPEPTTKPKSIYDAPFDVDAICSELIAVGEAQGLTHTAGKTPSDSAWASPVVASSSYQGTSLERGLKDYVRSMPQMIAAYGGQPIQYFTIYVEPLGGGSYQFYFLY